MSYDDDNPFYLKKEISDQRVRDGELTGGILGFILGAIVVILIAVFA